MLLLLLRMTLKLNEKRFVSFHFKYKKHMFVYSNFSYRAIISIVLLTLNKIWFDDLFTWWIEFVVTFHTLTWFKLDFWPTVVSISGKNDRAIRSTEQISEYILIWYVFPKISSSARAESRLSSQVFMTNTYISIELRHIWSIFLSTLADHQQRLMSCISVSKIKVESLFFQFVTNSFVNVIHIHWKMK